MLPSDYDTHCNREKQQPLFDEVVSPYCASKSRLTLLRYRMPLCFSLSIFYCRSREAVLVPNTIESPAISRGNAPCCTTQFVHSAHACGALYMCSNKNLNLVFSVRANHPMKTAGIVEYFCLRFHR